MLQPDGDMKSISPSVPHRTLSLQMVDAEPMGKYISYPHRAATFHIPIGLHVLTSQLREWETIGQIIVV